MIVDLTRLTNDQRTGLQAEAAKAGKTAQEFADELITLSTDAYYEEAKRADAKAFYSFYELSLSFPREVRAEQAIDVYTKALELGIEIPEGVKEMVEGMQKDD
ncbi:MAG TPA: hypothetical protein VF735_15120 [Pyrinomonadaceae bacterium]|jgi:CHASE1-domain containing sensor protein